MNPQLELARSNYRTARPRFIILQAFDPFDWVELCSVKLSFSRRQSASGFYTAFRKRMFGAAKAGCPQILEGREPEVKVTMQYF